MSIFLRKCIGYSMPPSLKELDFHDMCTVTLRQSAIFTIICMALNGYNLAYVLIPEIKSFLLSQPWFVYVPDVHNVTQFVGPEWSKNIMLGLAGGSIFFDMVMFVSCCIKSPNLLDLGRLWHYLDLGADVVVGLASANYTPPTVTTVMLVHKEPPKPSLVQSVVCTDAALCSGTAGAPGAVRSDEAEERSANVGSSQFPSVSQGNVEFIGEPATVPDDSEKKNLQYQQQPKDTPTPTKSNPYRVLLEPPFEMLWMYGIFVHHYKNVWPTKEAFP